MPTATEVGKVNVPLALINKAAVPLFSKVTEVPLLNPETVPEMVLLIVEHAMVMFETFADPTVPVPLLTEQVSPLGCVLTVTA